MIRLAAVALIVLGAGSALSAGDWLNWRGPLQSGVSPERDLPEKFGIDKPGADNLIWKAPYGCRTTPLVIKGRMFFITPYGNSDLTQQERVVCLDADTGKLLWDYKFNVFFTDIVTVRLGWTVLAADEETGYLYAHGTQGFLFCFDREGKIIWQRQLTEETGRVSGYGGRVTSPVVDGDLVVLGLVNASWGKFSRGGNRFVAFDKKTGAIAWISATPAQVKDTYSSVPVVAVINGERVLISGGGDGGIHGFQVRTGKRLWSHFFSAGGINPSPVVDGNLVYLAHGEDPLGSTQLGRVICLDASDITNGEPKLVWKVDGLKIKFSAPLLVDGRLYVCEDTAKMHCLDAKTGKVLWRRPYNYGRNAKGSPVWADGKIYLADVNSRLHVIKPGDKRGEEIYVQFFRSETPGVDVLLNGSPAIANGRIYMGTTEAMYCFGKPGHNTAPNALPKLPSEETVSSEVKPAQMLVYPGEVDVMPGQSVQFTTRLYDAKGRFLRQGEAKWSLASMESPEETIGLPPPPKFTAPPLKGTLTEDGKLTVGELPAGQYGEVLASAEGITARARVRQLFRLPYKQDFDKLPAPATPPGWINTQGKFLTRKVGESQALVKVATNPNPLVARADAFFGPTTLSDYTMEADVMGMKYGSDLPEVGITVQRYTLWFWGNTGQVRLTSWDALPRIDKTIAFPLKPDVWYRMKLTTVNEAGKFFVRGKVWERGTEEPKNWMLEVVDPIPNREGAPGIYSRATGIVPMKGGAEAYFDNLVVTPNRTSAPSGQ